MKEKKFRKKILQVSLLVTGIFLVLSQACNESSLSDPGAAFFIPGAGTADVLTHVSNNIFLQSYKDLESASQDLNSAIAALQTTPNTTNLALAQARWKSARLYMKRVEPIYYGPGTTFGLDAFLDSFMRGFNTCNKTTDCTTSVDSIIAGSATLNSAFVSSQGAGVRGLPALEYLLFDNGAGSSAAADIVTALTGRRLTILSLLSQDLWSNTTRIREGWDKGAGGYAGTFASASTSSITGDNPSLSLVVAAVLLIAENMKEMKLGYPAGFTTKSGGIIRTDSVESPYSNHSLEELNASLKAIKIIYTGEYTSAYTDGSTGPGLSALVSLSNQNLDLEIKSRIGNLETKILALQTTDGDLKNAINTNLTAVRELYTEIAALRVVLSTDLVTTSGTTPGVSPNDGD